MTDQKSESSIVHNCLLWHPVLDVMAVANYNVEYGGYIAFTDRKTVKTHYQTNYRKKCAVSSMQWHPKISVLAVAWKTGQVTLISKDKEKEYDLLENVDDLLDISCLEWSVNGKQLFVGDSLGVGMIFNMPENMTKLRIFLPHKKFDVKSKVIAATSRLVNTKFGSNINKVEDEEHGSEITAEERQYIEALQRKVQRHVLTKKEDTVKNEVEIFEREVVDGEDVSIVFIFVTKAQLLYSIENENKEPIERYAFESPPIQILDVPEKNLLVVLTEAFHVHHILIKSLNEGDKFTEKLRVKMSGKKNIFKMIKLMKGSLAFCYGDREIRVWDLTEDSAIFKLIPEKGYEFDEAIIDMVYNQRKELIYGITSRNKVAAWKRIRKENKRMVDQQWKLQKAIVIPGQITSLTSSAITNILAIIANNQIVMYQDQTLLFTSSKNYIVIQTSPTGLNMIKCAPPSETKDFQITAPFKFFYISDNDGLITWNDTEIRVMTIKNTPSNPLNLEQVGVIALKDPPKSILLYRDSILCIEGSKINYRTFQGTLKNTLNFREVEGDPAIMTINLDRFLIVGTSKGYLKVFDLNDPKQKEHHQPKNVGKDVPHFNKITQIKTNCDSTRVAVTIALSNEDIYERILVWDTESDFVHYFSFDQGITDQQQIEVEEEYQQRVKTSRPKTAAARKIESEQTRFRMPYHAPGILAWDAHDPRYLLSEAISTSFDNPVNYMLSIFVTSDNGIQMQDAFPISNQASSLVSVSVPYVYFLKNQDSDEDDKRPHETFMTKHILKVTLREFVGIDGSDRKSIDAMLNFSFYLTIGQMDNAFKAIQFIKSESVWTHMAQMCVKTRRLDVAIVCLGNMGHAVGARAVKQIMNEDVAEEVKIAMLAVQLGMIAEAANLYYECQRFDLLNNLYQACGKWTEAFEIASNCDRIHLKNTHYNYAVYLESNLKYNLAIEHYEKSNTYIDEVPRILIKETRAVELYVKRMKDTKLYRWWAMYLESMNQVPSAINFYEQANDFHSICRILCDSNNLVMAEKILAETNDSGGLLCLGRAYERTESFDQAVEMYTKAKAYGSAIRLAKEHQMNDRLANLAIYVGVKQIIEVAKYYEDIPGEVDKAIMLYQKANMLTKAMDLAFETDQFGALDLIVNDFTDKTDPNVLKKAAELYSKNQDDKKAVYLLGLAKEYALAVKMCLDNNVVITDEMADLLTPSKQQLPNDIERRKLLEKIGECCLTQGNYYNAAKKFAQAGNTGLAMSALLKTGDTPKIIQFANTARDKKIFKLAANYLQTSNWREDPNLMKTIELFYKKSDSYDSLAAFFDVCGTVEIDEYRDYEKAIQLFIQSIRNLKLVIEGSEKNTAYFEEKRDELEEKVTKIGQFLEVRHDYDTDPNKALTTLTEMVKEPGIDEHVRMRDMYTILILHNYQRQNYRKAYDFLTMFLQKKRNFDLKSTFDRKVINEICEKVNEPPLMPKEEDDETAENDIEYSHALKRKIQKDGKNYSLEDDD
uniref:ANAPC4_WD40 domain-containing protein n=1 Tax=Rhabditophanes sp. KR3021 TaxID=114890 RepID=A0AC35UC71_9BILA